MENLLPGINSHDVQLGDGPHRSYVSVVDLGASIGAVRGLSNKS